MKDNSGVIEGITINQQKTSTVCRTCQYTHLTEYINIGYHPLSTTMLLDKPQQNPPTYLMAYDYCLSCGHVQMREPIDPSLFYQEYSRLRSVTTPAYVLELSDTICKRVNQEQCVVEIGSNDGMFLQDLRARGVQKLVGVEAAANAVEASRRSGIDTIHGYYSIEIADQILRQYGEPAAIVIRHVLEHINDINTFMKDVLYLADPQTLIIIEVPDLRWAISRGEFTSFTDQHINYFTHRSLAIFLARVGLYIESISVVPNNWSEALLCFSYLGEPADMEYPVLERDTSNEFLDSMHKTKTTLLELRQHGRAVAFGGLCRTVNLINYLDIAKERIFDFIVDDDPLKKGKYLPGCDLIVLSPIEMKKRAIPFCVICAVNYEQRIMNRHRNYIEAGGCFVTLFPFCRRKLQ